MVSRQLAGVLLVALGVTQLVISLTGTGVEIAVALGGVAFLAAYLATRAYGLLVPGGVLTGVGVGLALVARGQSLAVLELGLAGGFLVIPVLQLVTGAPRERGWAWPLLPAGILGALGAATIVDARLVALGLPGLLVLSGVVAVASGARGAGKRAGRRQAAREAARAEREAAAALPPAEPTPPGSEDGAGGDGTPEPRPVDGAGSDATGPGPTDPDKPR
jgi:hypothetical protein